MQRISFGIVAAGVVASAVLFAQAPEPAPNTLTAAERAAGWRLLFDGKTTAGWRGYRKTEMPAGWQITPDGALTRAASAGDIVTVDQFDSFDLMFEWKIAPGGNSGVMFHVTEDLAAPWQTGPEFQILDNSGHADGAKPETSTASDYALHPPTRDLSKPAGSWNQSRLLVNGKQVEHWLNGEKVVAYTLESPEWVELVAKSKFAKYPKFGRAGRGHIALQDHGDMVAYRNIKIRPHSPAAKN
jgi:hypothetical protein